MKTYRLLLLATILSAFAISSCSKHLEEDMTSDTVDELSETGQILSNLNPYSITLLSKTQSGGNFDWTWAVKNNRPGNGNNGTAQDMSHWGMTLGYCLDNNSIVSAAYSHDGTHWNDFDPTLSIDPTACIVAPVLKFDFGTNGSSTSYFRLTVNQDFGSGMAVGYYKSGSNTGCKLFYFEGISCGIEE